MQHKDKQTGQLVETEYKTVALRVTEFRNAFPLADGWGILTEVITADEKQVVMKATVTNPQGLPVATGHAEETRTEYGVNSKAAMENAETSAIGRALAAAGFVGSEFASADEVARKLAQPNKPALKIGTPQFDNAVTGLKGSATMAQVKEYYHVTKEVETALENAVLA